MAVIYDIRSGEGTLPQWAKDTISAARRDQLAGRKLVKRRGIIDETE